MGEDFRFPIFDPNNSSPLSTIYGYSPRRFIDTNTALTLGNSLNLSSTLKLPTWDDLFKQNNPQFYQQNLMKKLFNLEVGSNTQNQNQPQVQPDLTTDQQQNTAQQQVVNPEAIQKAQETQQQAQTTVENASSLNGQGLGQYGQGAMQAVSAIGSALGPGTGNIVSNLAKGTGQIIDASKNLKSINDATNSAKKVAEDAGLEFDGLKGVGFAKNANIAAIGGAVAGIADSFLGERAEYSGDKGNITQTLDSVYDGISDAAMAFGPVGMIVGGAMKGADLLGDGLAKLGGGTDGMTTQDAILGSSFFSWNVGLINGFGGSTTDTIRKDEDSFAQVGASYTGTNSMVDDALTKSGKKYGLFSKHQFNKAQQLIAESKRQQEIMSRIAGDARDRFAIMNSMSDVNSHAREFALQGGYRQSNVRAARQGMRLQLSRTLLQSYNSFIPEISLLDFIPEVEIETITKLREGGQLEIEEIVIEEIKFDIPLFKQGGSFNVIPDGALHARLHHMENAEGLTRKGIPVVVETEEGEYDQQAEIERDEIIFRLEVTKKLEELKDKFESEEYTQKEKDEFAIEAGKILVHEILNNTVDNTDLINKIN